MSSEDKLSINFNNMSFLRKEGKDFVGSIDAPFYNVVDKTGKLIDKLTCLRLEKMLGASVLVGTDDFFQDRYYFLKNIKNIDMQLTTAGVAAVINIK